LSAFLMELCNVLELQNKQTDSRINILALNPKQRDKNYVVVQHVFVLLKINNF